MATYSWNQSTVGDVEYPEPGRPNEESLCRARTPVTRFRLRGSSAIGRFGIMSMALVLLAGSGVLTHFGIRAGRLSVADQGLMHVQRMGPPPILQPAYEELNADTVTVRSPAASHPMVTGMFVGTLAVSPTTPGVSKFLPGSVRHILTTLKGPAYDAVFVVPLSRALPRKVIVDLAGKDLTGTVSYENSALALAAVDVPVSQDELGMLLGPPGFFHQPINRRTVLRRLIVHLGLETSGGASFAFTSGVFRPESLSQCGTSISGAESGSPVGWVSLQGSLIWAGLAVPSRTPGQCQIIGSWSIALFLQLMTATNNVVSGGPYLGVLIHGTVTAHQPGTGRLVQGAYLASVIPASPADRAGLRAGDVVVRLDQATISSAGTLVADLKGLKPGTMHWIAIVRDGRLLRIQVKISRQGG